MSDVALRAGRATVRHASGVGALLLFGAPSLVASFVLARWSALSLIGDLAAAFGLTSTMFTAASFNLAQALALWGIREHVEEDFWMNRLVSSSIAALIVLVLMVAVRLDPRITVVAILVKFTDASADLRCGFDTLRHDTDTAMRRLLAWSVLRIVIFCAAIAVTIFLGYDGVDALLAGAVAQLVLMQTWRDIPRVRVSRGAIVAALRLARLTAHLSIATTMCALLVTMPRIVTKQICSERDLGLYGVTFMATTFIGMSFNLSWFRMASTTRELGSLTAMRHFLREGTALAIALVFCILLAAPLVAGLYGISDSARFYRIFATVGTVFVVFYYFLCVANMLKTSSARLLEAAAYLTAAVVVAGVTLTTRSVAAAMLSASMVLAAFVLFGVKDARRVTAY